MAVLIRQAEPADADLIAELVRDLAEYEKLAHEAKATSDDVRAALFCDAPRAHALIAELDGAPVGFALYFLNFSTFLGRHGIYLEDLFVRPTARGSGAGKALLRALAKIAVTRGFGRVEWSVLDWNEPAIGFYQSIGAVPMDGWTVYRLAGEALQAFGAEDAAE